MNVLELTGFASAAAVSMALNSLWLGILIVALAAGTIQLLPRPNAATRYAIWFTALILSLVTPVLILLPRDAASVPVALAGPSGATPLAVPVTNIWPVYAALAWAAVASILLARVLWSLIHIHGLKRKAALLSRRGNIRVLASPSVRAPMAAGFFHRAIVFPQSWIAELNAEEFEQVLCHELAHLRRWDDWTQLVQELARAVLFFNPAIHWIGRRLIIAREMACDDWVVASTGQARPYAACLTHLHELMRRHTLGRLPQLAPGASTGKRWQLTTRVEALLKADRSGAPRFARSGWIAAGALAGMTLAVAAKTVPPVGVQQIPVPVLAVALRTAPSPPISLAARPKAVVHRPHLLARRAGPEWPVMRAAANDYYLPVRAWQVEVSPTYFVITVVFFEPPPPTVLNGI